MIKIRKSNDRGHIDHGWLDTYHTFSFGDYYDPDHMGFSVLRVINDDRIAPKRGFARHPHKDMEIITYVFEGALEHKDSMGNGSVIKAGDIQYMSAGSGVTHSEASVSETEYTHLYQIWILPDQKSQPPRYDQKNFTIEDKLGKLKLMVSKDGEQNTIAIRQDVKIFSSLLRAEEKLDFEIANKRSVWLQLNSGQLKLNSQYIIEAGDGVAVTDETKLQIQCVKHSEFLLFDLPK